MALSIAEQETVISFSRTDSMVSVYTSDTVLIHRYDKYAADPEYPDWKKIKETHDMLTGETVSCEYEIPRKLLRLLKKERKGREYSEEEKEAMRMRLKAYREGSQEARDEAEEEEGSEDEDEDPYSRMDAEDD